MPFLIFHFQDSRQNLQAYHKNMYITSCYSCMLCTLRLINARVYALSFVPIWSARVKIKAMHTDVAEEVFLGLSTNLISPLSEIAWNKLNLPSICCKGRIMTKWKRFFIRRIKRETPAGVNQEKYAKDFEGVFCIANTSFWSTVYGILKEGEGGVPTVLLKLCHQFQQLLQAKVASASTTTCSYIQELWQTVLRGNDCLIIVLLPLMLTTLI